MPSISFIIEKTRKRFHLVESDKGERIINLLWKEGPSMKKQLLVPPILLLALSGCGGSSSDPSGQRVVRTDLYTAGTSGKVERADTLDILFKENGHVPYLDLQDGARLFQEIRRAQVGNDAYCRIQSSGNTITYNLDNGANATFDAKKQTIVFSDLDLFLNFTATYKPLTLGAPNANSKAVKITKQEYQAGKEVTFDLKPYAKLDIYQVGKSFYVPYSVFSDLLLSNFESFNLAYNFKDLYLLTGVATLTTTLFGETMLTELGMKYYEEAKQSASLSEDYAAFAYDSLCFNLDYTYGLKGRRGIQSFDSYFTSKGYRSEFLSGDAHTMDNALTYALSSLGDGHTGKSLTSPLYDFGGSTAVKERLNPELVAWQKAAENFAGDKVKAGIKDGLELEVVSGGAYISFNEFSALDESLLYNDLLDDPTVSTPNLFNYAYKTITAPQNKDKIQYVVVDLCTNDGGAIDSVIYGLGTLLGEIFLDNVDPLSGAHNRTYYKVDINADGKIDEQDKSLKELGYKILFLDSSYSFSSGNAMPVFAKENDKDVMIIGEKSAGGTCSARSSVSALGATYQQSGGNVLSKKDGTGWKDIEDGVPADHNIPKESMFDRLYIGVMVKDWLSPTGGQS